MYMTSVFSRLFQGKTNNKNCSSGAFPLLNNFLYISCFFFVYTSLFAMPTYVCSCCFKFFLLHICRFYRVERESVQSIHRHTHKVYDVYGWRFVFYNKIMLPPLPPLLRHPPYSATSFHPLQASNVEYTVQQQKKKNWDQTCESKKQAEQQTIIFPSFSLDVFCAAAAAAYTST